MRGDGPAVGVGESAGVADPEGLSLTWRPAKASSAPVSTREAPTLMCRITACRVNSQPKVAFWCFHPASMCSCGMSTAGTTV
ncbi:hypothetical protein NKH18_38495 [Streptomyces sp. M10(2022)]